ncbi:MAG: RecB family exonuclease [Mycobacteriales bacterium]|nr:PD-(D/E)XK nuclease family protein [Frankia sp.]
MDELPLPGVPKRLFACTPSKLAVWLDCPRRYRLTYLDRPTPAKGPAWAHNSFGATVHNALKAWWLLPRSRRTAESAAALVDAAWIRDGYRDAAQEQSWRARGRAIVRRYVGTLDADVEPLGVERTVATRTSALALSGRVDRLDDRDGSLVVVDYKTGRRPLSTDDARGSMALAIYAFAVGRMFRRPVRRVELHHLPTGIVHAWDHTAESIDRQLGRATATALEARDAREFPARPGPMCAWCDFARVCPEGLAAGAPRRPWEGLGDDAGEVEEIA